jgi:hypothetical protein
VIVATDSTAERCAAVGFRDGERGFALVGPESRSHVLSDCERSGTFYDLGMLEDLRSRLVPGDLVVDIGAQSVDLAALCACRVITLEPRPEALPALCENVRRNGVSARVEARRCAVGAEDEFVCWTPIGSERLAAITRLRHELRRQQGARAA